MKHVLVTFDLHEATHAQYVTAYSTLAGLGLSAANQNIVLPSTTVMGIWWADVTAVDLRQLLVEQLLAAGVPVKALLVALYEQSAWWRGAP